MTEEERVAVLHQKMEARRRMKERRKTGLLGAMSCVLITCLVALIGIQGGAHQGATTASLYSGATMLFEDVGGYVLLAIVAFMAGACLAVLCMRLNRHNKDGSEDAQ